MKKTNKKGFTIVELVIVVAVIAVLAAVLIPTFSGVIRKANISKDTATARGLNEAVAMSTEEVDTFDKALAVVKAHGYLISNLNAKTDGCYFVWETESKQFLLVDAKDDFKVLYSNTGNYAAIGATWNIAVSDATKAAEIEAMGKGVVVKKAVASPADFNAALSLGGVQTLYIDESLVMGADSVFVFDKADAVTTIQLGNSTISSLNPESSEIPLVLKQGTLTLNDGTISATGKIVDADGKDVYIPLDTAYGTNVTLNNTTFNVAGRGLVSFCGDAVANSVEINSNHSGVGAYHGANVVLNDANVVAGNSCIFVSNHSGNGDHTTYTTKVTINGGSYTCDAAVLEVYSGELEINGGTFKRTTNGPIIFLYNNSFDTKAVVKGGTFIMADGTTYEYKDLTVDILKEICKTKNGEYTVDITGNVTDGFVIVDKK